jgi:hypothetical protein
MAVNSPNSNKIYQNFPFLGPPKFTQSGVFGYKNVPSGNPGVYMLAKNKAQPRVGPPKKLVSI